MSEINEFLKIVAKFQKPLRLHEGDAKTIIYRFAYLKQKLRARGISDIKLLLTSIYCYTRTPRYGRKIMGPYDFVSLCKELDYDLKTRDLWRYQKLYFKYDYYSPITNATDFFNAAWYDIANDLELAENAKELVLQLIKEVQESKGPKRAPRTVVGTAVYLVGRKMGKYFPRAGLAEYFGISEVTLRNSVQDFESLENLSQILREY